MLKLGWTWESQEVLARGVNIRPAASSADLAALRWRSGFALRIAFGLDRRDEF